jgi:hypothetical protein
MSIIRQQILAALSVISLTGAGLFACKPGESSHTNDAGTLKSGVDAVSVYYMDTQKKLWVKSRTVNIAGGDQVFTINDKSGKPLLHKVTMPNKPSVQLQLVEVAFRNPANPQWLRGFVLQNCFAWDASKNLSAATQNGATQVSTLDAKGAGGSTSVNRGGQLQLGGTKRICAF